MDVIKLDQIWLETPHILLVHGYWNLFQKQHEIQGKSFHPQELKWSVLLA